MVVARGWRLLDAVARRVDGMVRGAVVGGDRVVRATAKGSGVRWACLALGGGADCWGLAVLDGALGACRGQGFCRKAGRGGQLCG